MGKHYEYYPKDKIDFAKVELAVESLKAKEGKTKGEVETELYQTEGCKKTNQHGLVSSCMNGYRHMPVHFIKNLSKATNLPESYYLLEKTDTDLRMQIEEVSDDELIEMLGTRTRAIYCLYCYKKEKGLLQ